MKRAALSIAVLTLLVCSLIPATSACDTCMGITREQAQQACGAQAAAAYSSCIILGGNVDYCGNYADGMYIVCMHSHGWPL